MKKRAKKTLSLFLAMAMLITSLGIQNVETKAADTNVVLGKTVTASSVEVAMPGNTADQVADGNTSTRWSSEKMKESNFTDADAQTAQWLVIDLQADEVAVSEIKVSFFKKVWATKYQIQTADTNTADTGWTTVKAIDRASGSLADNPVDTINDVTSLKRYVRFYFEKVNVNAGGTGVSVTEIAIAGEAKTEEVTSTNVALGKDATVSSVESAVPQNTADKAVDGSTDTRWSCNAMKTSGATDESPQTPQWLIIDLAADETTVSEIKISFFKKVWATKYQIQTADTNTADTEWTTVKAIDRASGSLADNPVDTINDVTSLKRYVRFYFEKVNVNAGGTGVSVTEIHISGTPYGVITPEEPETPGDELEPTYTFDFTTGEKGRMETLYGGGNSIEATAEGLKLTYSATRAGVVDKAMTPISDGIFEATIVPQENGARFGLIMRATDADHKVLIGTENNNNKWFWEYWGDNGNKWGSTVTGPALISMSRFPRHAPSSRRCAPTVPKASRHR